MRRGTWRLAAVGVTILALGACTGDDEGETEVAGAALERDASDQPVAIEDPDDERVDPRESEGTGDEEPSGDEAAEDPGDGADEDAPQDSNESGADEDSTSEGDADGARDVGADSEKGGSDDEVGRSDPPAASSRDDGADGDADDGSSAAPQPEPAPRPTPTALAEGPGHRGDAIGFGDDGTELLVGGPLESPPAVGVRSDALRGADGDDVRCVTSLQAPQDRGLLADGELTISLAIESHDGTSRQVPRIVMDLDVELEAGERFELPETDPYAFDRTQVAALSCEAEFVPR